MKLKWRVIGECNDDDGNPTCWAAQVNSDTIGKFIWIYLTLEGYEVQKCVGREFATLVSENDDLCEGRENGPDECCYGGFYYRTDEEVELVKRVFDCCSDGYDDEELRESTEEDLLAELLELPENSVLRTTLKYLCDRIEELESKENLE